MATDFDAGLDRLAAADELDTYDGPVPTSEVDRIGEALGGELPADYRRFVERFGFASWVGHSVYGVFDPADGRFPGSFNFSAVEQTTRARERHRNDPFPHRDTALVVGTDGMGGYFLLLPASSPGTNRVVWVNRDEEWVVTREWGSFGEFLSEQLATES